jgi:tetratricopeptide (TPR) repeat protein
MSPPSFDGLPIRKSERWQGAVVPMPFWTEREGEKPRRARGAFWVGVRERPFHVETEEDSTESTLDLCLRGLEALARDPERAGYLPGAVELIDASLVDALRSCLEPLGMRLEVVERVPAVDLAVEAFQKTFANPVPGIFDAPDVFEREARSFYEAARSFYDAAPWRELTDEDLIRIESPASTGGFTHAIVLGAARKEYGLCLIPSREAHERVLAGDRAGLERTVNVFFGPIHELPLDDAEWMVARGIEVSSPLAWPWALEARGKSNPRRPSARLLGLAEAVLRALAAATPDALDRGRFTERVRQAGRDVEVTLALPELLGEAPPGIPDLPPRFSREANERVMAEIGRFASSRAFESIDDLNRAIEDRFIGSTDELPSSASTPLERAQELCWKAWDARGRKARLLAREALSISPDCADAYVLLARSAPSHDETIALLRKGMAAGERALGSERFESGEGEFWGDVATRPYMRALHDLVGALSEGEDDERQEAIRIAERMLGLNPGDNQGIRFDLVGLYLETEADDSARELVDRFDEDRGAILEFARALLAFREEGDTASSRKALRRAIRENRFAAEILAGGEGPEPVMPDSYALGSPEEAQVVVRYLERAWTETDGAVEWIGRELGKRRGR